MKITKKQWIYGSIGVFSLGCIVYFVVNGSSDGKNSKNNTLPNGIMVHSDENSAYHQELLAFSNNKERRLELVTQLLMLLSEFWVNDNKVIDLITENLPDDNYMKIFKHTFYYHKYTKAHFKSPQKWDLKGWLENRLSESNFNILKDRYPSLAFHLKK